MDEFILCSAIDFHGLIICGYRHEDCYDVLKRLIGYTGSEADYKLPDRNKQGFLTSKNRYVNRKEAWVIAKANNQIKYGKEASENGDDSILISENLY